MSIGIIEKYTNLESIKKNTSEPNDRLVGGIMESSKEYKASEGTLYIELLDNGIGITYGSIDDYYQKDFSVDDLIKLLGYRKER